MINSYLLNKYCTFFPRGKTQKPKTFHSHILYTVIYFELFENKYIFLKTCLAYKNNTIYTKQFKG